MIQKLQRQGYPTIAPANPLRGETLGALISKYPGTQIPDAVREVPFSNPDGTTGIDL